MAKKIAVIVSKTAREDVAEILEYIRVDSPQAAVKIVVEIHYHLKRLPRFPKSGRIIPEVGDPSLREIVVRPYRLMYRLEGRRAVILRVLHGKRFFSGEF